LILRDVVRYWHEVAIAISLRDYSIIDPVTMMFPVQPGPTYTTRAVAIGHLALYDALVGITGQEKTYLTYDALPVVPGGARHHRCALAQLRLHSCAWRKGVRMPGVEGNTRYSGRCSRCRMQPNYIEFGWSRQVMSCHESGAQLPSNTVGLLLSGLHTRLSLGTVLMLD
jgi:hypothetical protein